MVVVGWRGISYVAMLICIRVYVFTIANNSRVQSGNEGVYKRMYAEQGLAGAPLYCGWVYGRPAELAEVLCSVAILLA